MSAAQILVEKERSVVLFRVVVNKTLSLPKEARNIHITPTHNDVDIPHDDRARERNAADPLVFRNVRMTSSALLRRPVSDRKLQYLVRNRLYLNTVN